MKPYSMFTLLLVRSIELLFVGFFKVKFTAYKIKCI